MRQNLNFLQDVRAGEARSLERMNVDGLETDAKERFCELCVNFAILNQIIIIIFFVHKHFIAIWNLLYVIWINLFMLKCVTENF